MILWHQALIFVSSNLIYIREREKERDHDIHLLLSADWEVGSGDASNGFKSVTAFYPSEASSGSSGNWLDFLNSNSLCCCSRNLSVRIHCFSERCNYGAWPRFYQIGVFWESWCFCRESGWCLEFEQSTTILF